MYTHKKPVNAITCDCYLLTLIRLRKHINGAIVQHKCFSWRRNFYQQLRGFAMGNRLAPILAILYMDRIEIQAIYSDLSLSISFCYRYIDDFISSASNHEEAVFIHNKLNSQDLAIRFEIELSDDDRFLPFLNTKIIVNESGIIEARWYTKPANNGLMLNEKSHHPENITSQYQ